MDSDIQAVHKRYRDETKAIDELFSKGQDQLAKEGRTPQLRNKLIHRSKIIDRCLKSLWKLCQLDTHHHILLYAVGGYGRRETFPASDIDILILHDKALTDEEQNKIEQFIQHLWDIGTPIGQSVRSLETCLNMANKDHTILANLLNSRRIAGSSDLVSSQLRHGLKPSSSKACQAFFSMKKSEYRARHWKHSNTEYNLEPNIKEAPGGLRDIHTLLWISKYTLGMGSLAKLLQRQILTEEELSQLQSGYDFIASVRYCLHLHTKRDENRLLFEHQKTIAHHLGFRASAANQAVEEFMKAYYRHASTIAALVELLLENVEEEILSEQNLTEHRINENFTLIGQKIAIKKPDIFKRKPRTIFELFYLLGQSPSELGVRANTIRLLRQARFAIDDKFRRDHGNTQLFLKILQSPYRLFTQLTRMKRYGILGRYLPEFGQVIGQMQFDLFHVYTVDAHALLVMQNMRLLRHDTARESFPLAHRLIHQLPNRVLLYIAGLYHDMAKGRDGDHSILGAEDVERFARRHELSITDTQLVTWLVLDHLIMSTTAQKADISDFKVVEDFATRVGNQSRLDYLYLLTICDIAATNPKLLTPWRLSLINQLYHETTQYFTQQAEQAAHWSGRGLRMRQQAEEILREKGIQACQFEPLWDTFGDHYFHRYSADDIVWHTQAILQHNTDTPLVIAGLTQESNTQVYAQIFIYTKECPYIFLNSVTILSELGLNIVDARIMTSKTHYTLNTYVVDDHHTGVISSTPQIYAKICAATQEWLMHSKGIPKPISIQLPRAHRHFDPDTQIQIYNHLYENQATIVIETLDRTGLLAGIGRIFAEHGLSIHAAKILTFGERIEDFFFVSYQDDRLQDQHHCQTLLESLHKLLQQG